MKTAPIPLLLLSLLQSLTVAAEAPTPVTIGAPGRPPAIVVPAEMEDQVKYAVEDLQNYLTRITDLPVPVIQENAAGKFGIFVGDVPANRDLKAVVEQEHLGRDGFVFDVSPQGVRILGGSKFGTAYGVDEFLERLGVRWLFPGQWGEVVPHQTTLSLPAGRFADQPAFTIRRMACNYSFHSLDDSDRAAGEAEIGDWRRRLRHNDSGYFGHSNLIPTSIYGKEHPEWFAEIDGRRVLDPNNWKLCHSNKAMVQQAIAEVFDQIRQRKADKKVLSDVGYKHLADDYFVISVSPTDGGGFCRCAECQKMGTISDRLQIFANTIADAVRKEFPEYWVGYYAAYSEAQMPPTVAAQPGVMVFTTAYTKTFFSRITDTANNSYRNKLEGFFAKCPNTAMADFDGIPEWWGYGPISYLKVHEVDYPWYRQRGVQGISTHASSGAAASGYSSYLTSKLWWHPDADVAALRRDFVNSGFGEASGPMSRYYQKLDQVGVWPSPEVLYAMRQDLAEAATMARRPDIVLRLDYLRAYHFLLDVYTKGQAGTVTPEELLIALRVRKSIDYAVTPLNDTVLSKLPGCPTGEVRPYTREELHQLLDRAVVAKPGDTLSSWADGHDLRLIPMAKTKEDTFPAEMGTSFRWGPNTLLIYARANEPIKVTQQGKATTDFELRGPEQTVLASGSSDSATIIDRAATTEGIYTLVIYTGTNPAKLQISNRAAVIKASASQQSLRPTGRSKFYFFVPKDTREFAFVTRAKEPLTLAVWGPSDAVKPVLPLTSQSVKVFQENRITVPEGASGKIWRVELGGADRDIFLQGIPPFLASDPSRLLVLP